MIKVRKGLIAAAGRGTRFLPVVKAYPKELVPILDKPNIQYLVEELIAAGIDQIAIVYLPGNLMLKRFFTPDSELENYLKKNKKESYLESLRFIREKVKVFRFIPQSRHLPYGNASPVLAAKSFLGNGPFVYMFGDDLILEKNPGAYLRHLIEIYQHYQPAIVLGAQKMPWSEVSRYAGIKYVKDKRYPHRAIEVLEKLPANQAPSNIVQLGRFVVSPRIFPVLAKQQLSSEKELWFADTVNILAKKDVAIAEPVKNGEWLTTGDPQRWLKANIKYGLKDKALKSDLKDFMLKLLDRKKSN